MKNPKLETLTIAQLVARFAEIGVAQDEALLDDDLGRFNRLFVQMQAVSHELKSRAGDQRSALLLLYKHSNAQVRVKAAKHTLAVAPKAAREMLKAIQASQEQPQALEAGMSLWNLDRGVFKPT